MNNRQVGYSDRITQHLIERLRKQMFSKNNNDLTNKMTLLGELQDRYNFLVETNIKTAKDSEGKIWDFDLSNSIKHYEDLIKKIIKL